MGKKKIATAPTEVGIEEKKPEAKTSSKKHFDSGVLYVESTYNNTKLTLTDNKNNTLAAKAQTLGIKEVRVVVKGVGSGRESAIRGFISKGINLTTIQDKTAVPHNGPKPPKPRRT